MSVAALERGGRAGVIVFRIDGQRRAALLLLLMFNMLANDDVCADAEFAAAWCDSWDGGGRSDDVTNNAAGGRRTPTF
jgi:hypothetical protein